MKVDFPYFTEAQGELKVFFIYILWECLSFHSTAPPEGCWHAAGDVMSSSDCLDRCSKGDWKSWIRAHLPSMCTDKLQLTKVKQECQERGSVSWCLKCPHLCGDLR